MPGFDHVGKLLILAGLFLVLLGVLVLTWGRIPLLGKLPGDIFLQKGNFQFFFPLVTCLILSAVLTLIINLVIRLFGR